MARSTPVNSGYTIINGSGSGPNGSRIDVWVEYKVNSQSTSGNTSNVTAYFYAALRSGQSSDTYSPNSGYSTFSINGVSGTNLLNNGGYDFRNTTPNHLGTWNGNITHNSDGSKSVSVAASFSTKSSWITGGSVSGTITLPKINRYANITNFAIGSITSSSFNITWGTDASISHLWYRLNSTQGTWIDTGQTGTSGTIAVSGLTAGSTYMVEISVRHASSGLDTYSSEKIVYTNDRASSAALSHSSRALGSAITVTITRYNSIYDHTIQHNFTGSWVNIATGVATSQSWTLPAALASSITNATSKAGSIRVRTYRAGTHIGDVTIALTATVPNNATYNPTISGLTAAISGSGRDKTINKYVQNFSKVAVSFTSNFKYGATATSQSIKVGTVTYSGTSIVSGVLTTVGTIDVIAYLTDSRGRNTSSATTITVHAYAPPSINLFSAARVTGTKTATVSRTVNFYALDGSNPISMTIRIRPTGGSWSNLEVKTGQTSNITGSVTATGLVDTSSYELDISVLDTFGKNPIAATTLGTVTVSLSVRENMGIAVGKYHEGLAAFEVGGTSKFGGNVAFDGTVVIDKSATVIGDLGVHGGIHIAGTGSSISKLKISTGVMGGVSFAPPNETNVWRRLCRIGSSGYGAIAKIYITRNYYSIGPECYEITAFFGYSGSKCTIDSYSDGTKLLKKIRLSRSDNNYYVDVQHTGTGSNTFTYFIQSSSNVPTLVPENMTVITSTSGYSYANEYAIT